MEPVFLQHYDQIEIDDDEEDQLLDSDPEDELPAPASVSAPAPPPPPPVTRDTGKDIDLDVDAAVPRYQRKKGETIFPSTRIENILRADGARHLFLLSLDGPPTRLLLLIRAAFLLQVRQEWCPEKPSSYSRWPPYVSSPRPSSQAEFLI